LQTISAPISLAGPTSPSLNAIITTATVNDSIAFSNTISGNGGILATGSGTVALTGSNTYLGGTTISGGVVQIDSASSMGASTGTAVINAGTLEVLNSISTTRSFELGSASSTIQIDGGGTYEIDGSIADVSPTALGTLNLTIPGGSGTLILTGNNTFSGGTNIPANATLQLGNTAGTVGGSLGANGILTNNGVINVGASLASPLAATTTVSIGSNIAGTGPLNQFGGSLVLSGSNANFSGAVTITNGTLVLGGTSSTGTGTGNLALTNTAITETASGTIGNNPASGAAASAISTLTITGALNIDTGGANNMLIGAQLIGATGTSITRTGGTGMLSLGIAGNTNFSNAAPYTNAFAGTFTNNIGSLTLLSRGSGSNAAQFNFNAGASYPVIIGGIGGSINFGSLSGNQPIANLSSSAAGRLVVGNLNMSTTYSGVIGSANSAGSGGIGLLKLGSGSLTLTGQNMYAGQALTAVTGTPTVVQSGTLIAGSTAASDGTYGPFGPTTPLAAGIYPNYVLLGSNGNLSSANLLASGVTVANPIVVSGGGNTATTGSYTLALGGNNTTGTSVFSGGVTLENNLTVTQTSGGTVNLTGGITGTDAFTGPDSINGAIDHGEDGAANTTGTTPGSATGTAANNTGYQTVTFAGPGNITVNALANTTNSFGIYDSNDPNNQNNDGSGHYLSPNGFVSVSVTGGTTTFAAQNQYSGATSISGGTLILGNLANASTPTARTQTSLSVSGGELQIALAGASGGSANGGRNVPVLTGVPVPNTSPSTPPTPVAPLTISGTGTIDLTNNDMLVQNVGVAGAATISSEIASGRANGSWTGTGITSSAAAASPTLHALGMELNDTNAIGSASLSGSLSGSAITSSFDGQSTYDGDVMVKYTYVGDADLSGTVNAADYLRIDNAFSYNATHPSGPLITGWANGDFNYDGVINGDDYSLIDNAFNSQGSVTFTAVPASAAEMVAGDTEQIAGASSTAVPEPAMIGLIGLGVTGLLKRRRRNCSLATK
jgi:autotransporter-associated beta strand protein